MQTLYVKNVPVEYKKYVQHKCIELECDLADYVTALIKKDMDKPLKEVDVRNMQAEIRSVGN